MNERLRTGEGEASCYDTRSTRPTSTSSRVIVSGPRQRPKGPRTSDISRSSLVEYINLPLSPLAREISIDSVPNVTPSTPTHPPDQHIALAGRRPSRLSVSRFSFRRSKLKSQNEDRYVDDPFKAIPHPSVRQTAFQQQAKPSANALNLSSQPRRSSSMMTPASQTGFSPKSLVPLKSKRSFFRRLADKFTRAHSATFSGSEYQKVPNGVKHRISLSYVDSPTNVASSQLPTPSFLVPRSLLVVRPDEMSPINSQEDLVMKNPSLVKLPKTLSVRSLPVIPTDDQTVDHITSIHATHPTRMIGPNGSLYRVQSTSLSWQPITPISPLRATHTPEKDTEDHMYSLRSKPAFNRSLSKFGDAFTQQYSLSSKEKATSVRSVLITDHLSFPEKRKAMSLRSYLSPAASLGSNTRGPQKEKSVAPLNKRHDIDISEDSRALVNLDKAMFEKELAREKEGKSPKGRNLALLSEKVTHFHATRPSSSGSSIPLIDKESRRHFNDSLVDSRHLRMNRALPAKPTSAPNPSSSGSKRGLMFSVNLETNSEVNIPSSNALLQKHERFYPDVLYTAGQSGRPLSPLQDDNSSRRSLPRHPSIQPSSRSFRQTEDSDRKYVMNDSDKVSQWLVSTSQSMKSNGSNNGFAALDEVEEESAPKYGDKKKGKAPIR